MTFPKYITPQTLITANGTIIQQASNLQGNGVPQSQMPHHHHHHQQQQQQSTANNAQYALQNTANPQTNSQTVANQSGQQLLIPIMQNINEDVSSHARFSSHICITK
jgi:hypothetical protein